MSQVSIAIVEDDQFVREAFSDLLSSYGYKAAVFANAEDFLEYSLDNQVHCLLLDQGLPGMTGLELQEKIRSAGACMTVIFITAQDDASTRRRALVNGAYRFLAKCSDVDVLIPSVLEAIARCKQGRSKENSQA